MADDITRDLYHVKQLGSDTIESTISIGKINEKDKFVAAKQILFGLAVLYVLTIIAYLIRPSEGNQLLEICTTTFPPLATLILVTYFKDRSGSG